MTSNKASDRPERSPGRPPTELSHDPGATPGDLDLEGHGPDSAGRQLHVPHLHLPHQRPTCHGCRAGVPRMSPAPGLDKG